MGMDAGPASSRQEEGPKGSSYDVAASTGSVSEAGDFPVGASAASEGVSEAGHASRAPTLGKLSLGNASSVDTAVSSATTLNPSSGPGDMSQAGDSEQADSLDDLAKHQTYSVPEELPGDVVDDEDAQLHEESGHAGMSHEEFDGETSSNFDACSKAVQHLHAHHGPSSNGDVSSPVAASEYKPPFTDQQPPQAQDPAAALGGDLFAGLNLS